MATLKDLFDSLMATASITYALEAEWTAKGIDPTRRKRLRGAGLSARNQAMSISDLSLTMGGQPFTAGIASGHDMRQSALIAPPASPPAKAEEKKQTKAKAKKLA